jgi:thiol-disulfide isomerase/thioredoxin
MQSRAAALAVAAVLLASACTGGGSDTTSGTQRFVAGDGVVHFVSASSRKPGPALSGTTLDGSSVDAASLGSGPLVVNIWGSWCAPCKVEQDDLERVHRATSARGVAFLGINIRDSGTTAPRAHVKRYGVTYPSLYDPAGKLLPSFKVAPKTIPSTFVLDRQRRIAAYVYGAVTESSLMGLIDRVLAE